MCCVMCYVDFLPTFSKCCCHLFCMICSSSLRTIALSLGVSSGIRSVLYVSTCTHMASRGYIATVYVYVYVRVHTRTYATVAFVCACRVLGALHQVKCTQHATNNRNGYSLSSFAKVFLKPLVWQEGHLWGAESVCLSSFRSSNSNRNVEKLARDHDVSSCV